MAQEVTVTDQQRTDIAAMVTERRSIAPIEAKSDKFHLDYLDGMRAFAALYVVMHHVMGEMWSAGNAPQPLGTIFFFGRQAVSVFITLSGFSLMIPIIRTGRLTGGSLTFYLKRARRIIPPYLFSVAIFYLFIVTLVGQKSGTLWDVTLPVTVTNIFTHIALMQDIINDSKINYAFWSVSVEWHIYILFPLLVLLYRYAKIIGIGAMATTLVAVYFLLAPSDYFRSSYLSRGLTGIPLVYITLFLFGMMGAIIVLESGKIATFLRTSIPWLLVTLVFLAGAVLAYVYTTHYSRSNVVGDIKLSLLDVFVSLTTTALLISGVQPRVRIVQYLFGNKVMAFFGTFSYSIYLTHALIIHLLWYFIGRQFLHKDIPSYFILAAMVLPTVVVTAYLFHLCFERPFLNTKPSPDGDKQAEKRTAQPALVTAIKS